MAVTMLSMNSEATKRLKELLVQLETRLQADTISIVGEIRPGLEGIVRLALQSLPTQTNKLAVVLHTGGGVVEIAERMVHVMRHFYEEVVFIIPNVAMSAGTVLAMSGDA